MYVQHYKYITVEVLIASLPSPLDSIHILRKKKNL